MSASSVVLPLGPRARLSGTTGGTLVSEMGVRAILNSLLTGSGGTLQLACVLG